MTGDSFPPLYKHLPNHGTCNHSPNVYAPCRVTHSEYHTYKGGFAKCNSYSETQMVLKMFVFRHPCRHHGWVEDSGVGGRERRCEFVLLGHVKGLPVVASWTGYERRDLLRGACSPKLSSLGRSSEIGGWSSLLPCREVGHQNREDGYTALAILILNVISLVLDNREIWLTSWICNPVSEVMPNRTSYGEDRQGPKKSDGEDDREEM